MSAQAVAAPSGRHGGDLRGSTRDRKARREYLIGAYRADVDILVDLPLELAHHEISRALLDVLETVPLGDGEPCCRCYRCGVLLTLETVTVDRIIPGCLGGRYVRNNIRPACGTCNSSTGGHLGAQRKAS